MKNLVIIPTFNEAENVQRIIDDILNLDVEVDILFVDDNSPDGTGKIVEEITKNNHKISLIKREKKMGLGSAYVAGFKYALKREYDNIFEMDADLSHDPKEIPNLLEKIKDYDLVIGSRYIKGINVINWPLRRLILSYGANIYTRIITGIPLKDSTGGYKCFRRKVLENIDLNKIHSEGYAFQIEMNYKTWKKGFRIIEIPIIFMDRTEGKSKMSRKVVREAILIVWKLRLLDFLKKL